MPRSQRLLLIKNLISNGYWSCGSGHWLCASPGRRSSSNRIKVLLFLNKLLRSNTTVYFHFSLMLMYHLQAPDRDHAGIIFCPSVTRCEGSLPNISHANNVKRNSGCDPLDVRALGFFSFHKLFIVWLNEIVLLNNNLMKRSNSWQAERSLPFWQQELSFSASWSKKNFVDVFMNIWVDFIIYPFDFDISVDGVIQPSFFYFLF